MKQGFRNVRTNYTQCTLNIVTNAQQIKHQWQWCADVRGFVIIYYSVLRRQPLLVAGSIRTRSSKFGPNSCHNWSQVSNKIFLRIGWPRKVTHGYTSIILLPSLILHLILIYKLLRLTINYVGIINKCRPITNTLN